MTLYIGIAWGREDPQRTGGKGIGAGKSLLTLPRIIGILKRFGSAASGSCSHFLGKAQAGSKSDH